MEKKYGVKIIVVSIDNESKREKALTIIKDNNWSFEFYFDYDKKLYAKVDKTKTIPQTIVYDANFKEIVHTTGIKPKIKYIFKEGKKEIDYEMIEGNYAGFKCDLKEYETALIRINNLKLLNN